MSVTTIVVLGAALVAFLLWKKLKKAPEEKEAIPVNLRKDPYLSETKGQFSDLDDGVLGPVRVIEQDVVSPQAEEVRESKPNPAEAMQNLIIVYVMAKGSDIFMGYDLMQALVNVGLENSKSGMLDYMDRSLETPKALFHVASAVEPGKIDLNDMASYMTPGLCLFMNISGLSSPDNAFVLMLDAAKSLADELNAQLVDFRRERWTLTKEDQYYTHIQHMMAKDASENHWSTT